MGILVAAQAIGSTNAAESVTASNCLQHIDAVIIRLELLAEANSNATVQASCLADKLVKAHSLRDLVQGLTLSLEEHRAGMDDEAVANDSSLILAACARVDRLAEAAAACQETENPKVRRHSPTRNSTTTEVRPPGRSQPVTLGSGLRDVTSCMKQAQFAALFAEILGIETGKNADAPSRELSKRTIEPLGGWNGDDCLTVDDLCVVVARALHLKVETPDDPYSYVQAVRNDGLPVDSAFPRRPQGVEPALLLEGEVRQFLAQGYAVRFPSGRKVNP